ncbi:hypothetical protein DFJ58DRAFT_835955 [Suillus subalutaceus]|uniref:uncharacterized protein n=1 Tax=Suillus subalutaceus TaxID=48586 RepID=UPI001B870556|nr:uncharacterized protein DFJ58DRAFT_835955 [Suillus subalutaceus]KAG1876661.1 hypothetical protein DFJ58DRAFT_835955 [Suillus subalutaceus]
MVMPRRYIRIFVTWLRLIVKKTALRSYKILSILLRIIRRWQDVMNKKRENLSRAGFSVEHSPNRTRAVAARLYREGYQSETDETNIVALSPITPAEIRRCDEPDVKGTPGIIYDLEVGGGPFDNPEAAKSLATTLLIMTDVIFWFKSRTYRGDKATPDVERKHHVRYALESQYWSVWPHGTHLFPNKRGSLQEAAVVT